MGGAGGPCAPSCPVQAVGTAPHPHETRVVAGQASWTVRYRLVGFCLPFYEGVFVRVLRVIKDREMENPQIWENATVRF